MVPRDFQYKNLSLTGRLATGKLTYADANTLSTIVASGPNTIFRKTFSSEDFNEVGRAFYTIEVDDTRSKVGDQISIFFKLPTTEYNYAQIIFSENVYITICESTTPEYCRQYRIFYPNTRFLINLVYTGNRFINTNDTA